MNVIRFENIPADLRELPQWVLWRMETRKEGDKPTKVPYQTCGKKAQANNPATWSKFSAVRLAFNEKYTGIGFEFSSSDEFCGIDLDGCRDPQTGKVAEWARQILLLFATYSEVSPSGTGVKLFIRGKLPYATGKKKEVSEDKVTDKTPAIEIYDTGRYFAVTGQRLAGLSSVVEARQNELEELLERYFPNETPSAPVQDFRSENAVFERARKYIAKLPPAVSGQDGHGRTFHVACVLVLGFDLSEGDALTLMREYNQSCQPPWSEKELLHKVKSAANQGGERGFLRNAAPDRWSAIRVPSYQEPARKPEPRETTLLDATRAYVERLRAGEDTLIGLGIGDLEYAIGGGVEKGEMVILAARPSHGKSAVGLQFIHHWTSQGMPCAIISEEMAALALGKRTLQFTTDIPEEHWKGLLATVERQIEEYGKERAPCIVLEGCGTAETARAAIERVVREHKVECVVVDYAQLLGSPGRDRYQQMTNMSVTLRQLTSSLKIVLVALCQMSRDIESRNEFRPKLSDIKETGQLEQDADVIVFLLWPYRIDQTQPMHKYQFFVEKVRNRQIMQRGVVCRFAPSRQKITDPEPEWSETSGAYRT